MTMETTVHTIVSYGYIGYYVKPNIVNAERTFFDFLLTNKILTAYIFPPSFFFLCALHIEAKNFKFLQLVRKFMRERLF